ncbi:MAG: ATP-binding cassette domain-containing protein, partial [Staphylococcus equorum]|nr:ATP-binding cassette domain-containing protein [Staphylococcus equorum]
KNILLKELNVNVDLKRKISILSGGEQQRIALIRLLLKKPNIILADEPTGSLDRINGEKILDKLLACLNDNKIIIIATHDIDVAKKCNVVVNMEDLNDSLFNNLDTF